MKKFSILVLSLASLSLLASCDNVEAKLQSDQYNQAVLNLDGTTNNALGKIYDALITEGDTNSAKVLNNVLYLYSQSIYGDFFTMKDAVDKFEKSNDATDLDAFAAKYAVYKTEDATQAKYKVINFYSDVLYRIRSTFLGYVTNSSYQIRNQFLESKFYDAQIAAYYNLTAASTTSFPYNKDRKQVLGSFRLSEDYAESGSFLLDGQADLSKDTDTTNSYFKNIFGTYSEYIKLAILPDIYRSELTSQYLYSQNFGQIKQTAYRKVDYISLAENAAYVGSIGNLMTSYCKNIIAATTITKVGSTETIAVSQKDYDFTFLGDLYKGTTNFQGDKLEVAKRIYNDADWHSVTLSTPITVDDWTISSYYKESAMGTIIESYEKLTDNRFTDDTTVRNDFTNSGAYPVQTGLTVKTRALVSTDKTVHGWYDKSGLSSLASALSTRLFKVQTATEVDSNTTANETLTYGRYVNGNYYLLPENSEAAAAYPYLYKDSSDNWYLVKVEEAVKPAKISSDSTGTGSSAYYDNMTKHANDHFYGEVVARKISYSLASNDTWKNKANKYYVNDMALLYHDTYVYNYFKTTFPSLFE
jgi:hypothetical protein